MVFGLGKLFGGTKPATTDQIAPVRADTTPGDEERPRHAFVRRDAVFNRERRIVGHLYRLQLADAGLGNSPTRKQRPLDDALLNSLCTGEANWGSQLGFIPLCSASLDHPLLNRLPAENTVLLLVLAPETPDAEGLLPRLQALKERGIRIGLFRQPRHPAFGTLLDVVDFAAVDVAEAQGGNLRDFSIALRASKDVRHLIELFGANIETLDDLALCNRCNFGFFHGPFAQPGQDWEAAKGDPHKMHLMHLLNLVQGDAETAEIALQLKQDPLLTYRILRYLNSPAIGLTREITSIDQALVLLGRQKLVRWLSVLLFSVKEPDFADWLLVESSLGRGRIMELLGAQRFPSVESDHLFLTGVFSTLDKLLRIPMTEAVEQVKLPTNIRTALLERAGPYAPLLAVAEACEAFDPERITKAAEQAGLNPADVNQALLAATSWASEVTSHWE